MTAILILLTGSVSCTDESAASPEDAVVAVDEETDSEIRSADKPDISAPEVQRFEGVREVTCVPACAGKKCGDDGCGGTCGFCNFEEVCDFEGVCKDKGQLQGLGEACLPTESCFEGNSDWPDCLDKMCASGECLFPFCTQKCGFSDDTLNNHTGEPGPDGVEDEPYQSCGGAIGGPMGASLRCVNVSPNLGLFEGKCLAGTTFGTCKSDQDCPENERCGLLTVSGLPSLRCLGVVKEGVGTGEYCSAYGQLPEVCGLPALCSADGCTAPCLEDDHCVPNGIECLEGGCNGEKSRPCSSASDCSPWRCRLLLGSEIDDSGLEGVCEPRNCAANGDCRDPQYLCELRLGSPKSGLASWNHVCVLPNPEATLSIGDTCTNGGEGAAQCPEEALCYKGVCSALCRDDRDCEGTSQQRCAVAELPINLDGEGGYEHTLPLRVCETFEFEGRFIECSLNADCTDDSHICAPIELPALNGLSFPYQIQSFCRTMNPTFGDTGDSCGLNPGEGECKVGFCGLGGPGDPIPMMCSEMCEKASDCPPIVTETGTFPAYCRASLYGWNNNINPADDLFVSTCWPALAESTLNGCDPMVGCEGDEVCVATLQASDPTMDAHIEWLCMVREKSMGADQMLALGAICVSDDQCLSGRCRDDKGGKRYCTVSCETDSECLSAGQTMICVDFPVLPRVLGESAVIRECRKQETCIPCAHHNDCFKGMRCIQTGGQNDIRTVCAYPCEVDQDCVGQDGADTCRTGMNVDGFEEGTCAPNSCAD